MKGIFSVCAAAGFLIAVLMLHSLAFGQGVKPEAAVAPISTIGGISASQQVIILNQLLSILSSNYQLVSMEDYGKAEEAAFQQLDLAQCTVEQCIRKIQELLQVERLVTLQLIKEGGLIQLSLVMSRLDDKVVRSDICENCKTSGLIAKVRELASAMMIADLSGKEEQEQQAGRLGVLVLIGQEDGDKIKIDGQVRKATRGGRYVLPSGQHSVSVEREGFTRLEETPEVVSGSVSPLSLVDLLQPLSGKLTVKEVPKGATVRLSGGTHKPTSLQKPLPLKGELLPIGVYDVTATLPDFPTQTHTIEVREDEEATISIAERRIAELKDDRRFWAWWLFVPAPFFVYYANILTDQADANRSNAEFQGDVCERGSAWESHCGAQRSRISTADEQEDQANQFTALAYIFLAWGAWLYWVDPDPDFEPSTTHNNAPPARHQQGANDKW